MLGIGPSPDKMLLGRLFSAEDGDFGQSGARVRKVDDTQRAGLVSNVAGHLPDGVSQPILEYWRNIDKETGDKIADAVRK